ncbi:MAG: type I-C CRISPR-associated protein Cas5c [Clostridiales Family XIII bacterium]|nr:type I-C CRISPR-associated protein Cas5c [Clostridiales Family XIII bacterium]
MAYGIRVELEGRYALFTRPELKVERLSYEVPTHSAARGILEAIMWKPAIRYHIDRIYVMKPIRFENIRRNEVSLKASAGNAKGVMEVGEGKLYISTTDSRQQRAATVLKDVRYIIDAHFTMTDKAGAEDTPEKFYNMILRRLRLGQCFHQPCFGVREFPAKFQLFEGEDEDIFRDYKGETRDLGLMLYEMDYSNIRNIRPTYVRAVLKDGVIDLQNCEVLR